MRGSRRSIATVTPGAPASLDQLSLDQLKPGSGQPRVRPARSWPGWIRPTWIRSTGIRPRPDQVSQDQGQAGGAGGQIGEFVNRAGGGGRNAGGRIRALNSRQQSRQQCRAHVIAPETSPTPQTRKAAIRSR